jgi:hypothetical protein
MKTEKPNLNLNNERGNLLIIFLLAMAISTLAVFSFYYTRTTSFIANSVLQSTGANIQVMQANLVSFIYNPLAFSETLADPVNGTLKSCMMDATFDCPQGNFSIVLRDGRGGVFYDSTLANTGFDFNAIVCSTYNTSNAGGCQLRFDVTWSPECPPTGPCFMPSIVFNMNLALSGYKGVYAINPAPYRYVLRIN